MPGRQQTRRTRLRTPVTKTQEVCMRPSAKRTLPTYSLEPQVAYREVLDQTRKTGETKATKKGGWLDVE